VTDGGADVSEAFLRGAHAALERAIADGARLAILKEGSPSCGSGAIRDGSFTGARVPGRGVSAALLERHGIRAFSEAQLAAAAAHLASLATGRVVSIQRSRGGVPKHPVPECEIGTDGLEGDAHRDPRHGGPERALVLYSLERLAALQREGHPIGPGSLGENLTLSGLDWAAIVPGARLRVGRALIQVTRYTTPCHGIAGALRDGAIERVAQKSHPGWSRVCARVLAPGRVAAGDDALLMDP
jgi:MOSC domain-containing protein YiiM